MSAAAEDAIVVEAMNPELMVKVTGEQAVEPIAAAATVTLRAAMASPRNY